MALSKTEKKKKRRRNRQKKKRKHPKHPQSKIETVRDWNMEVISWVELETNVRVFSFTITEKAITMHYAFTFKTLLWHDANMLKVVAASNKLLCYC